MAVFDWFSRRFTKASEEPAQDPPQSDPTPDDASAADPATEEPATDSAPTDAANYLEWAKAAYQNIKTQQSLDKVGSEDPAEERESATEEPEATVEESVPDSVSDSSDTEASTPAIADQSPAASPDQPDQISEPDAEPDSTTVVPEPSTVAEPESSMEPEAPDSDLADVAEPESVPESLPESAPVSAAEPAETIDPSVDDPISSETETEEPSAAPTPISMAEPSAETVESTDPAVEPTPSESASPVSESSAPLPFWAKAEAERLERLERLKEEAIAEPEPDETPAATDEPAINDPLPDLALDEDFIWSAEVLAAQGRRPDDVSAEEITWLKRLRQGLGKTRRGLVNQLRSIVGQGPLNQDAVMEIESILLQADVGIEATDFIIESLQERLRQEALPPNEAIAYLKQILRDMLEGPYDSGNYQPHFIPEKDELNIWLITGVNGAGKTTTIGKLAHIATKSDYRCLIAAADTFRAAAVEQVKIWGQRSEVDVIANPGKNTDPAAVVYDAIAAANSRKTELLLVDTAGRLQNKKNLMDELSKIRRIIDKKAPGAKIESLLVLDATLGQNGLRQAEVFAEAAKLSGVVLTKLDGTARGGVALAVVKQLGLPIRFIGAGEGIEDLRPFSSYEFVEALLNG